MLPFYNHDLFEVHNPPLLFLHSFPFKPPLILDISNPSIKQQTPPPLQQKFAIFKHPEPHFKYWPFLSHLAPHSHPTSKTNLQQLPPFRKIAETGGRNYDKMGILARNGLTLLSRRSLSYRNQSICRANQWTGFYMIGPLSWKS